MTTAVTAPHVYRAINAITAALAKHGIQKTHKNSHDHYLYRSIDDVLARLAPLLARHRLCVLPRVLRRKGADRVGEGQSVVSNVCVLVAYDLVSSRDGSGHTIKASGEALDSSDKATAKAMSAAYKSAMLQTFCVPVAGGEDADENSPKLRRRVIGREPAQGWQAWADDIVEIIGCCETVEALDRVRANQAALLTAVSRERADLYTGLGVAFTSRTQFLSQASPRAALRREEDLVADTCITALAETADA